jgi:hypothetical protein
LDSSPLSSNREGRTGNETTFLTFDQRLRVLTGISTICSNRFDIIVTVVSDRINPERDYCMATVRKGKLRTEGKGVMSRDTLMHVVA